MGGARAGVDRRPLEVASEDKSGAELRDAFAGGLGDKAPNGGRPEPLRQPRDLLHDGVSSLRAPVLRRGRVRPRADAGAQARREVPGSRGHALRRRLEGGGKSKDQQHAAGVRGRQVRAGADQR